MIFGFLSQNLKTQAVAVAFSIAWPGSEVEPRAEDDVQARDRLAGFRGELYRCLTARADPVRQENRRGGATSSSSSRRWERRSCELATGHSGRQGQSRW